MRRLLLATLPILLVVMVSAAGAGEPQEGSTYDRFLLAGKPLAQVGVPVVTPFEVDDTERGECAPGPRGDLCVEQAYGNLSASRGPAAALEAMRNELREGTLSIDQCHFITHNIGYGAVVFYDRDFASIIGVSAPDCSEGYLHGTFAPFFADVSPSSASSLAERAALLCSAENATNEYAMANCGHGVGHAVVLQSGYNLPLAIVSCDLAWPDRGRLYTNCLQGVFMENFIPSHGVRSPWVSPDDLTSPCPSFDDQAVADACFVQLGDRLALTPTLGLDGFARICGSLVGIGSISNPDRAADRCFYGLGRHIAMKSIEMRGSAPLELCAVAAPYRRVNVCLSAYVVSNIRLVRGVSSPGDSEAARLCRLVGESVLRDACWWGVGKAMLDNAGAELIAAGTDLEARCRIEEIDDDRDLRSCVRGLSGAPLGQGSTL